MFKGEINKHMNKVSVIIPIYNVEKYLEKCLDSIIKQSYTNLEIILVNDGSTDNSREICFHYLEKDKRFKLIEQKNQGLSAARNTGLVNAIGEYILFIDSDDYIATNMIEYLVQNLEENQVDMATCGIFDVYKGRTIPQYPKCEKYVCDAKDAYKEILIGEKIPGSICTKLMRYECIKDLRFPVGKHYEDAFFHIDLMQKIQSVCVDTKSLYYYVHREGSITTVKYQKSSYDIIDAYKKNIDMIKKIYPDLIEAAEFREMWANFVVLDRILLEKEFWKIDDYNRVVRFLKENVVKICKNSYFTKNRKIAAIMLKVNVRLYKYMVVINKKSFQTVA